ncbi:hypothetical protein Tco_0726802 [Tanacetum coccineum]|uniref:Reverse transcriptase domain-containing protein n=1 Tax=Tanacetum coccineum TaxID=301880 RepID=A0ABQ4YIU6_9ASTR
MFGSRRSRDMSKYYHFHEDYGHDTNDCRQLRNQIEEVVKSGQLSHLVKGIKKEKDESYTKNKFEGLTSKSKEITFPSRGIVMEYLVSISKRRAFWSVNKDILKIYYSEDQYAISIKEDTAYPCLYSPKTTKERRSIRRIQKMSIRHIEDIVCEYSGRYQTWSVLQETPIGRIQSLGYADEVPPKSKNDMPLRDK